MKSVLSGIKLLVFLYILSFIEAVKSDEYDLCDTEICGQCSLFGVDIADCCNDPKLTQMCARCMVHARPEDTFRCLFASSHFLTKRRGMIGKRRGMIGK